ncbi:NACHT domain-containing protein [Lentzea xinjiangensis]|uniref:NACHT domain-containing protein n=1 Tax=Lentzea xinjiangensis TaxID=402600 RepID=A0A1H9N7P0_9PSEU|nr:NACHT domain-containing protein [Lentzea xinjiangensis]SER31675.1 NACHT domain-containing protein [Lentzea xinjiangensis]
MVGISVVSARVRTAMEERVAGSEQQMSASVRRRLVGYLRSSDCVSLIELLCNVEHSSQADNPRLADRRQLREAFREEFVRAVRIDVAESREFAAGLWAEAERVVRELAGKVPGSDKIVIRATGPERPVRERLALAIDEARHRVALDIGVVIRQATAAAHERMIMPHSKADYRFLMEQIYVPRVVQATGPRGLRETRIHETALTARRFVVVGNPGAGKSTFIRRLVHRVAGDDDRVVPMVLLLKQHQALREDFATTLARELRPLVQREVRRQEIADLFDSGAGLVVFDGLDEVGDANERRTAVAAIEAFAARFPLARIVVTCREESYPVARLDGETFPVYRLPDFDQAQVGLYVHTWFELVPHHALSSQSRATAFLHDSEHVHDLRSNPLMLSLLCMLYQNEGYIPENTADVYRECAELMLVRWDAVSHVPSLIKSSVKLAKILVQELARYFFFELDGREAATEKTLRRLVVAHLEAREEEVTRTYHQQAQDFLDYCAERAWVLTQVDTTPDGERLFGFTHRTFMEYYTACHVLRTHESAEELVACLLPMITSGKSHVVPLVALQVYDMNRADGGDTCLRLFLDAAENGLGRSAEVALIMFCLGFLEHNTAHHATVEALLEHAFALLGATGSLELRAVLVKLRGWRKARVASAARAVIARTADRRDEFADIRLGAGLVVREPAVAYEVALGEARHNLADPARFVLRHRRRTLVYALLPGDGTEYVAGPLMRACGEGGRLAMIAFGPYLVVGLTDLLPIPASVVPKLVANLVTPMPIDWFTGLFCVIAAAAFEVGLGCRVSGGLFDPPTGSRQRLGEYLLAACPDSGGLEALRGCLRRWTAEEMSFVDLTR